MIKVILDTDIGDDIDDAVALALAMKIREIELCGVVTTYRNSRMRAKIAMALLDGWDRKDIPVYCGLDDPIKEPYHNFKFEEFDENGKPIIGHYEEYMRDYIPAEGSGIEYIAEQAKKYPHEIVLVAIGPLTDVAEFVQKYPQEFSLLKEIVIMGGRFDSSVAEWNIKCDPEAAKIVFESGASIRLVPLDVTLQCVLSEEELERFRSAQSGGNRRLGKMISVWMKNIKYKSNPILHDPLALASTIFDFCGFEPKKIRIGTEGAERGVTIEDEFEKEVLVATTVRSKQFTEFVCDMVCGAQKEAKCLER